MRDSFVFYRSFYEAMQGLSDEEKGQCFEALANYAINGVEPEGMEPVVRLFFLMAKPIIDNNNQKYENGKLGGRPKNQNKTKQKPNDNQTITKQKPNNNQTETNVRCKMLDEEVKEKDTLKGIEKEKTEVFSPHKKLVPLDWLPKEATIAKLKEKGFDANKVVEKFINSCHAKNLKYIDFDRAVLAWDWSRDSSVKAEEECWL